jgi:hypothetical protein
MQPRRIGLIIKYTHYKEDIIVADFDGIQKPIKLNVIWNNLQANFLSLQFTKSYYMHSYIFRILENDGAYAPAVNSLITKYHGSYKTLKEKDGFIYETEFETEEDVEKFRRGLTKLLTVE